MGLIAVIVVLGLVLMVVAQRRVGAVVTPRSAAGLVLLLLAVALLGRSIRIIPAGSVGVVDLFGRVSAQTLKSGIQFVNPFARVVTMSIKTQELKEVMDVPSKEGLTMNVECSVLFHLDPEQAADVYRTIGQEYVAVILEPQFRSVTRGVTAGFEAKALYTSEREHLAQVITADLQKLLGPRGVLIESVADFQRIVAQGISPELLRWKGIEATTKIAESSNSKVIVIGAGKDGLPLILGGQ